MKEESKNSLKVEQGFRLVAILIFLGATIYFYRKQIFLPSAVTLVAGTSYLSMYLNPSEENVEKFRYIDWAITTPIMLYAILTHAKVPIQRIVFLMILDVLMIMTGYLSKTESDWTKKNVWFYYGGILYLVIAYALFETKTKVSIFTLILWTLYPVIFILNEYDYISNRQQNEILSVVDVISKVGFGILLV